MTNERRTCVITGGSRGIGLATALRFAKRLDNVVIAARTARSLEGAVQQIVDAGALCEAVPTDVGTPAGAKEVIDVAIQRFGRIDVLVNNAGAAPLAKMTEFTVGQFRQCVDVNIGGVFYATRAAWPHLMEQESGTIVNISSAASVDPFQGFAVYGACKAWVNLFTQAIAEEGRPLGIRALAVAPGAVETKMLRRNFPDLPRSQTLDPDQVAAVVEAVCEPPFIHTSGQTVFVRR
jgi:NAD(P)-dependent dehydrogenase (short-subunit alcohol dehydrogenase family)